MMRTLLVYFAALSALFLFMRDSEAAPYSWSVSINGQNATGSSVTEACSNVADKFNSGLVVLNFLSSSRITDIRFLCTFEYFHNGNKQADRTAEAYRNGTECSDPDSVYNGQTGQCESDDLCGDKTGDTFNFSISGVGSTDYMFITSDGSFSAPSQRGCFDGCSASTVDQSCQTSSLGPWRCGGTAVFDGGNCGEGTESPEIPAVTESSELEKPAAELTTENQPCNYITQPDGSQTCTSLSVEDYKGQICGTFNGQVICPQIQPEYDSTQIDTTVTTEDNGDGTTTTTKTDVATITNCTGTSCNTSTTTNTTTNNGGSISGTCTGAQCPSAGNPDGNGDGLGDCVGSCEGSTGPLSLEGMGEGTSFGDTLDGYYNRITGSPIASAVTGISMPSNGSCSFPTASTYLFDVDLNFICQNADWLDPLRYVFLAIWAFAAVRVLMSA